MEGTTDSSPLEVDVNVDATGKPRSSRRQKSQRSQKNLACQRCRRRKQKCTETRPCENCLRSGSECILPASHAVRSLEPEYVRSLEERVVELEALIIRDHPHQQTPMAAVQHSPAQNQALSSHFGHAYEHSAPTVSSVGSSIPSEMADLSITAPLRSIGYRSTTNVDMASLDLLSGNLGISQQSYLRPSQEDFGLDIDLDRETHQHLIDAYFNMAHSQFPLLLKHQFMQWAETWSSSQGNPSPTVRWKGFFVHMRKGVFDWIPNVQASREWIGEGLYTYATSKYLSYVLASPDPLVRAQALLLLTIYALHVPSSQNLITLSSYTMRFCVMSQLHLAETEPPPTDTSAMVLIQHRRRIFWCTYIIERAVCGGHDLPPSIPDSHITVPVFNNIDDDDLLAAASFAPPGAHLVDSTSVTNVSSALHVLTSRQLRSEIQEMVLRKDFISHSDEAFEWRARTAEKINDWNTRTLGSSSPSRKGYASYSWLRMIYYYLYAFLYRPTRITALGIAGDLSVQACCQALLAWRKIQVTREIAQPWLGLVSQFHFGITLLYCFYATPKSQWKPSYKSADVPGAIRACSSTLAVIAEWWSEVECMRDVFEILARDIPHSESLVRPSRISDEGVACIEENWQKLTEMVIHRHTLRMIREMASEEFIFDSNAASDSIVQSTTNDPLNSPAQFLSEEWDMEWPADLPMPLI